MPSVPIGLRAVAVLALITVVIASSSLISTIVLILGAIYVAYWLLAPRPWSGWLAVLTAPAALAAIVRSETGQVTDLLWVCPALALGFAVHGKRAVAVLAALVGTAVTAALLKFDHASIQMVGQVALPMTLAFLAATAVRQLLTVNHELVRARQQVAVAAVEEERTRFARDLHDLLGHTMTVLVAKVRLARRLPADEAAVELGEAEHLALDALDEVRQAVAGYRGPTLDTQIAGARIALDAAGINLDLSGSAGPLVDEAEHALAFSVREAVTNVLRHSGASRCAVILGRSGSTAWVEIRDNGRGGDVVAGWGLEGLRERADRVGGTATWESPSGGGFSVRVAVPAESQAGEPAKL
jgi:two-component system sensor histidine kinase DesK